MTVTFHEGDLPDGTNFGSSVAVDTETMGLDPHRDRLCLVQLSAGDGDAHLVRFAPNVFEAPNLARLLSDDTIVKIFHFARFDIATLAKHLGVMPEPVYCTKIASKLARTYTDRHSLKDLVNEILDIDMSKQQQSSDWGSGELSEAQVAYAASDVLYLHRIRAHLDWMLEREGRLAFAEACFRFLPVRARLDLQGGETWTYLRISG